MKKIKQQQVLYCLSSGKYKVIDGDIYTFHKGRKEWNLLKPNVLPSGYLQYALFNSRRGVEGIRVIVYKHIAIYLFNYGEYPEGYQIDHKDRDINNNLPSNLEAKTAKMNIVNSKSSGGGCSRPIRANEINKIRILIKDGLSQSKIAKQLNLNRLSVRYTIDKINKGIPLKYDS